MLVSPQRGLQEEVRGFIDIMRNAASTSAPHLEPVLWDQVVVPELADEGERVVRAGQLRLLDVEEAQQLLGLQVM